MSNVIEILLTGRNATGPAFNAAGAQVRTLGRELANLNPAVGGAIGQVEGLASAFGGVVGPLLIAGAAIAGIAAAGVGAALKLSDTVEQLDRIATRTGVGIEPLQVLRQTLEEGGGNAESLTMALSFLNRAIATQDPILKQLGITTKDTFTAFMQLATALGNSTDAGKRTEIAYQLLGRGSAELLGNLKSLVDTYGSMDAAMRANGAMITSTAAPGLRELDGRVDSLKENWKGLTNNLGVMFTPVANAAVGSLNNMTSAAVGFAKAVREQAVGALEDLAAATEKVKPVEMLDLPGGGKQAGAIERGQYALETTATRTDSLAGISLNKDKAALDDRTKSIKAMTDALMTTGLAWSAAHAQAVLYYDQLKRLEQMKAVDKMVAGAAELAQRMKSVAEYTKEAMDALHAGPNAVVGLDTRGTKPMSFGDFGNALTRTIRPVEREGPTLAEGRGTMYDEVANARQVMEEILSVANMTREGLQSVFEGLQSGFQTAFQGIIEGTMNLRQALVSIFQSMVSAIIAELARLAAAQMFKFLLSLMGGGIPGLSSFGGGAGQVGWYVPTPRGMAPVGAGLSSVSGQTVTNNNITINGFDTRSTLMQYTSPSGSLRRAQTRLALAGTY